MTTQSIRIVDNRLGMSGENISFSDKPFFGLKVGERVVQIGDGRENGTIRTDSFAYPLKYVGSIILQFDEQEEMFAFQLPEKVDNKEYVYLLYGTAGNEIFTEAVFSKKDRVSGETTSYVRFYAPVFKTVTQSILE